MAYNRTTFLNLEIVQVENEQIIHNEVSLGRWILDAIILLFSKGESYDLKKRIEIKPLGFFYIPDIYLEKGCIALQLTGKTIIEIKNNLLFDTEIRQSEIYKYLIDQSLVDNLVVVYIHADKVPHINQDLSGNITLANADSFVNQIKKAINDEEGDVVKALNSTKPISKDWHSGREDRLINAINDYNRFDSVLFLGAGVSASANVPNWNELLKGLMNHKDVYCKDYYDEVYQEMNFSNLMTARYIRKVANLDKKSLVESVRKLLYSNKEYESDLVAAICAMVKGNDKVRSIITYNYDTLIEEGLNNIGKRSFSIYKNNRGEGNDFPIYHVHGIVYRNSFSDAFEDIVLSEEDYHDVYSQVFDWSNVEQLHALTRCTCFFIGLSLKDPNLRRLLEIAKKRSGKSVRHYAFLERTSFSDNVEVREKDFEIRENLLADLGLNVIWYEGGNYHKELPILLQQFC